MSKSASSRLLKLYTECESLFYFANLQSAARNICDLLTKHEIITLKKHKYKCNALLNICLNKANIHKLHQLN